MAARKTVNFLPTIFQTEVNRKFLSATVDQLVSEPNLKTVHGYIGRKFAPTYKARDSYIIEDSADRQNYQLEPGIVVRDDSNNITFFASYTDLLNKIDYYGGLINNHSRLFDNEYYSFNPHISYDKIVNFGQYYWLPNGPDPVTVNTSDVDLSQTFIVTRDSATDKYKFTVNGEVKETLIFARGGQYTFKVDQPGYPFWIQTELGIDGQNNSTPTISTRDVFGVTNNGDDAGTIEFQIPQSNAQDRFADMDLVYNVDYAAPIAYSDLHNQLLSKFLEEFPQYAGITGSLDGKTLIFVDQDTIELSGEEAWTAGGVFDRDGLQVDGFDAGTIVPDSQRYGVWRVQFTNGGTDDPIIKLVYVQNIDIGEKVFIKYGLVNANKEFYKEFDGFFYSMPVMTSLLDTMYIQDGTKSSIYKSIKIVDSASWLIDVENDIISQPNYTSPNGVKFTSGLKIRFEDDVTPPAYQNKEYYVENVGDSIRLVDVTLLVTPETYNSENAVNYPLKRVILSNAVTETIDPGEVITIGNVQAATDTEIAAGRTDFTTLDDVLGIANGTAVTGPGIPSGTTTIDIIYNTVFPEYITIKRDALDLNPWARNNRWFHAEVILATAEYNNTPIRFDQLLRAQRPIVQFESDLQLINNGRIGKRHIDILDTNYTDAFNQLEGEIYTSAFGIELFDGCRVLFAADTDPLVRDKIYVVNLEQFDADPVTGIPTGDKHIKLTVADDGDSEIDDCVTVLRGQYKGSAWWYDGTNWLESQQKTQVQQEPQFDVFDENDVSYTTYPRSSFTGTSLFGYVRKSLGVNDTVLGFPLSYRNFGTQGDIEFQNFYDSDQFTYVVDQTTYTLPISRGLFHTNRDRTTFSKRNCWSRVVEPTKQYQLLTFILDGTNTTLTIDILPETESTIPYTKVFVNNSIISSNSWSLNSTNKTITLLGTGLVAGDKVDILIYSKSLSKLGYYQIPLNLDLNAQNIDLSTLTLGQIRNHLIELSHNDKNLIGSILGSSNLRDIEIKSQGGNILQHSAPIPLAALFLLDNEANFIEALRFAQREYSKFKNKFLELAMTLVGIDPLDPASSVDLILSEINKIKNSSFPWYYSDMVPYGPLKTIVNDVGYTVFNPLTREYEITNVFDNNNLSNKAVLVYLNDTQLIFDRDYTFNTDRPAITILDTVTLEIDDVIKIVEYSNTDGNYIPETPSKLGLYPKFIPNIFVDDTYVTPISVVKGHDGSITPAFNDYRDYFLLELESRIYNNIKLPVDITHEDIYTVLPGKFRDNEYTLDEANRVLTKNFLNWVGNNKLDYSDNDTFDSNNPFTWNYSNFTDRISGEKLPGGWRACYRYFYDTARPHLTPWEMLGFAEQPNWWQDYYGPAPYTGGNKLLWDDLEAGRIVDGERAGIDLMFARPGLSTIIPVDDNGILLSPVAVLARSVNAKKAANSWAIGSQGPVETSWRRSSEFPFAVQQALALTKPAKYFGSKIDLQSYRKNTELNQFLTEDSNHHVRQNDIVFNGDTSSGSISRTAGYLNYIADYLLNLGINPATKIYPLIQNYNVNLAYKMAGFSDQKYLQVLAEQSSPSSTNDSIIVPNENYNIHLFKSIPVDKIVYSAVIIEKTSNGYSVRGYDLNNPYFTIIPSVINSNARKIVVLNKEGVVYLDYQPLKLTVPYGYEFNSMQQIVDFLISYERFLIAQGFTFNDIEEELAEIKNWKLSVREFLFWAQQGWKEGSILVMSPVSNVINVVTNGSIVDEVTDSQYGSRVLDQNFKLIKNTYYNIVRTPTNFKFTLTNGSVIAYLELNLVQYEHILVFDNTTVFNDIIYKPELGNRQFRLKLIGQKTAAWDGSLNAPGFIYNSGNIQDWQEGKDYLKGELVKYKNQYYVALENIIATGTFDFAYWKQADYTQFKTGLLPNPNSNAVRLESHYDPYGYFNDAEQIKYSHGLIGFKSRQYLDDLGLNETTQVEFYKGYIKQKGTANAIEALTNAEFNNLSSAINYYEEWAIRIGEYGALDINPYIEVPLAEKEFSVNPAVAEFVPTNESNRADGITVFDKGQLYKTTEQFDGNIALVRDDTSDYFNDIPTAGYVNIDDVDTYIFSLENYQELNDRIDDIGTGYTIWVAKDFSQQWNVYRVSETDNHVNLVSNDLDGYITFTTDLPHGLEKDDIFLIKSFDEAFDGFYQVYKVITLTKVMVTYAGDTSTLTTIDGSGEIFKLDSLRFTFMEDVRVFGLSSPLHRWKAGEKIWVDIDAPTSLVQGQPYDTGNNLWKVYEKNMPWELRQRLLKGETEYTSTDGFGRSAKLTADGLSAAVGSPTASRTDRDAGGITTTGVGAVSIFSKNYEGEYVQDVTLSPDGGNTFGFGTSLSFGQQRLAVGAPTSQGNIGLVYVYDKSEGTTSWNRYQILTANTAGDKFGHHIAFDAHATWLYVGALGNDRVYAYGLNTRVPVETQQIVIEPVYTITFSGNLTANVGNYITQSNSSANLTVSNISVSTTSTTFNVMGDATKLTLLSGNVFVNGSTANVYPITYSSASHVANISLDFTPFVANSAHSISVISRNKTYIPTIDFNLLGGTLVFNTGNVALGDVTITQRPYYALMQTIDTTNIGANTGAEFGFFVDSSNDGAQLAVGVPNDTVNVAVMSNGVKMSVPVGPPTANVVSYTEYVGSGAVYVYDRVIEAFDSTDGNVYTTTGEIRDVYRVTVDDIETTDYEVTGSYEITFNKPIGVGRVVYIETNQFNLLEKLIGIDSIEGGLDAIQSNTRFGTSLTICSNNCAIYVGAPYYDNGTTYNTGAVWKFHNRGRLYGTNTAAIEDPTFTPNDTIRLDNYEVKVNLRVSGNLSANAGDYITQASSGANVTITESITDGTYVKISAYNNANVFTLGSGNISVNGTTANVYPRATTLDEFVEEINSADLLGISAVNEHGKLRIDSDRTVAKNLLRILSGSNTTGSAGVYDNAGMTVFAFMQIIINPYNTPGEYFGSHVILAQNAYMLVISSERGTTKLNMIFDDADTMFDDDSTIFTDVVRGSGSTYIYELYDDPRDEVENPGRYAFAQQLNPGDLNPDDLFGSAIDVRADKIIVTAPGDDYTQTDSGSVYIFDNPTYKRGWGLIRYEQPKVDVDSVNRMFLYNKSTNTILTNLEFIDPAKGKILGQAEQEITYKTE